jgi:hypothetical protein
MAWVLQGCAADCDAVVLQVLGNSYAFAFFFFGQQMYAGEFTKEQNKINQDLFEDNQEMLATEVKAGKLNVIVLLWHKSTTISPTQ